MEKKERRMKRWEEERDEDLERKRKVSGWKKGMVREGNGEEKGLISE